MKLVISLLLVFFFASCGRSSKNSPTKGKVDGEVSLNQKLECLDKKLNWLAVPPTDHKDAISQLSKVDFESCEASNSDFEKYSSTVLDTNPNFNH